MFPQLPCSLISLTYLAIQMTRPMHRRRRAITAKANGSQKKLSLLPQQTGSTSTRCELVRCSDQEIQR